MPQDMLRNLQSGQAVRITVVGGSVTVGHNCKDGNKTGTSCAWPQQLQQRLQQVFPNASITLRNKARPAYSYRNWLESGAMLDLLVDTDILLVDLQVNSQVGMLMQVVMHQLECHRLPGCGV